MLRSYDCRFRKTDRSPEIYLDSRCKDVVGGEVTVVVESPAGVSTEIVYHDDDPLWTISKPNQLRIIALPYKKGTHGASKPVDFVPLIDQLIKLHGLGYVHGDIRGFNVVFGDEGGLIDFDFGGIAGIRTYPQGYQQSLRDGFRLGSGNAARANHKLEFYHDWYALGNLMFYIHYWDPPPNSTSDADRLSEAESRVNQTLVKWSKLKSQPSSGELENLKDDLRYVDHQKWTVCPTKVFAEELSRFKNQERMDAFRGATGSPEPMSNG